MRDMRRTDIAVLCATAVLLLAGAAASAFRAPMCLSVMDKAHEAGRWYQRITPGYWTAPDWASDIRIVECRDGQAATWVGDAPDLTLSGFEMTSQR